MMKHMSLAEIATACGGTYVGDDSLKTVEVNGVVIDSRKVEPGYLFVAVKGERVDGHTFIPSVFDKGAACVLCEDAPEQPAGPYIQVSSTLEAIKAIAACYRSTLTIPVVGISGSVGKTSTKEMIASILGQHFHVLKTEGNFNNEIGLPLTIFRIREEHEAAVLEMGISDFGEMTTLASMAKPTVCVLTNIGLCHLENLKTRDGILKAKTEMFDQAMPGAQIIVNGDDDKLITLKSRTPQPTFFGLDPSLDLYAENVENLGLAGSRCDFVTKAGRFTATIPIPGHHMVYNALAGTAVGLALGLTLDEIRVGIETLKPVSGRNHLIHTDKWDILDDCYNANPVSMAASLDVLTNALGRKVAILGDMGELGENEKLLHYNVGCHAADNQIDAIFAVGELSKELVKGVHAKDPDGKLICKHFDTKEALFEALPLLLMQGDSILVKASHFMEFPEIVKWLEDHGN